MARKLSLLLAAIATVAVAAPTLASASELTFGGSKALPGAPVTVTSTNAVTKTSIGNLTCASKTIHGEVVFNNGSNVGIRGTGTGTTATCFFKGTTPITIDAFTMASLDASVNPFASILVSFAATLPSSLTCEYSGTVPGTYTSGSNKLKFKGSLFTVPAACGTATIEGDFTLTSSKGAVILH